MAAAPIDFKCYLSGGASNADPDASLGGIMSSTVIVGQTPTRTSAIPGVVVNEAHGNDVSGMEGTLYFDFSEDTLKWVPPLALYASAAYDISLDGSYAIEGGDREGWLHVTITGASLPGADDTETIKFVNQSNKLFDDIPRDDSKNGEVDYRCFFIKNTHGSLAADVFLFFRNNSTGSDEVSVAFDSNGKNSAAVTVGDDETEPEGGLAWVKPLVAEDAISITLSAGDYIGVWFRREVFPYNAEDNLDAHFELLMDLY